MVDMDTLRAAARKAAGQVDYISLDERRQMGEFLSFVSKTRPKETWTFGEAWDEANGWRVVWQVGDIALVHPSNLARGFIRDLAHSNRKAVRPDLPDRKGFEDMLGDWLAWARRVKERRRRGDGPGTGKTPLLRSIPTGELAQNAGDGPAAPVPPQAPMVANAEDEAAADARHGARLDEERSQEQEPSGPEPTT
jgi:hypothetical protein